jgi:hypothetical protein
MKHINPRAILFGCVADIASTTLFSLTFGMITTFRAILRGVDAEAANQALVAWSSTTPGIAFSLFFGLFFTGVGGYVAAHVAKNGTLINSGFVGSLGILLGLFFLHASPLIVTIVSLALSIPVALLGGYLRTSSWKLF